MRAPKSSRRSRARSWLRTRRCSTCAASLGSRSRLIPTMPTFASSRYRLSTDVLPETGAIVFGKPLDLSRAELRCNGSHACVHVIAPFPRRIELQLLHQVFGTLLREDGRLDRPARAGAVARRAWRDVAARVTKLDELHDRAGGFGERRRIGIALWLAGVIGGDIGNRGLVQCLRDTRHERVRATPRPVVIELLVDRGAGLPCKVRKIRRRRNTCLSVASDAYLLHLRTPALHISARENLKHVRRPCDLRDRCRGRSVRRLRLCGRAGKKPECPADCRIGIEASSAPLDNRNDDHAKQNTHEQNGHHRNG